jgi:Asp/Glu/hydantoin racemase
MTKIALISATPLAIPPAAAAIATALPDTTVWNLLDDRLLADAEEQGGITAPLAARMDDLIELALAGGADGVLLTCSQFGTRADVRDRATDRVAVLSADGPLFAEAAEQQASRILLVASLESAAADSAGRLSAVLAASGSAASVTPLVVRAAARPPQGESLDEVLGAAIAGVAEPYDLVVLAQYSLAAAAGALAERFGVPVLDGPSAAARRLATEIAEGSR